MGILFPPLMTTINALFADLLCENQCKQNVDIGFAETATTNYKQHSKSKMVLCFLRRLHRKTLE